MQNIYIYFSASMMHKFWILMHGFVLFILRVSHIYAFKKFFKKWLYFYKFSHGVDYAQRNQYIEANKNQKNIC